ncbi:MAG: FMN-binding protein [Elusimicrobia bacterium]|nr:FMN-binding protein [Elusimicrobiota bacterium]
MKILLFFLLNGAFAVITQSILVREIINTVNGTELVFGLFFLSWLAWAGLGAFLAGKLRGYLDLKTVCALVVMLPAASYAQVALVRIARCAFPVSTAEILPAGYTVLTVFAASSLFSVISGALFPSGLVLLKDKNCGKVSDAYAAECAGSLAGGAAFSLFLIKHLDHSAILSAVSVLYLAVFTSLFLMKLRAHRMTGIFLMLFFITQVLPPGKLNMLGLAHGLWLKKINPAVSEMETVDTPYQRLTVTKYAGQYSLLSNGKFMSAFPLREYYSMQAAFYLSQNPGAARILVIGTGAEGFLSGLLRYNSVKEIYYLRLDPAENELVEKYLSEEDREIMDDPRIIYKPLDARLWVNRDAAGDFFDMAILNLPDPSSAFINRYYTEEFYGKIAGTFKKNGVLVTCVTSAANYMGQNAADYSGSVYHTLKKVFKTVIAVPGDTNIFFASSGGTISGDHAVLEKNYLKIDPGKEIFDPGRFASIMPGDRLLELKGVLENSAMLINTDQHPVTYYLNLVFFSSLSSKLAPAFFRTIKNTGIWLFILPLAVFLALRALYAQLYSPLSGRNSFDASAAVFMSGVTAMAAQIIILLSYQNFLGYIYQNIALITSFFMAGLAAGSYFSKKNLIEKGKSENSIIAVQFFGAGFFFLFSLLYGYLPALGEAGINAMMFFLTAVSGATTGALFPLGVFLYDRYRKSIISSTGFINGMDNLGAAAGALFSGAFMAPLVGIRSSLVLLGIICMSSAIMVFLSKYSLLPRAPAKAGKTVKAVFVALGIVLTAAGYSLIARGPADSGAGGKAVLPALPAGKTPASPDIEDILSNRLKKGYSFRKLENPFIHYVIYNPGGGQVSSAVRTSEIAGDIKGYAGHIDMLVIVSGSGTVEDIVLLGHRETPEYTSDLDKYVNRYKGLNIFDGKEAAGVDALSRASVTCDAVRDTLLKAGRILSGKNEAAEPARKGQVSEPRGARDTDINNIKKLIREGYLPDKESMFYRKPEK